MPRRRHAAAAALAFALLASSAVSAEEVPPAPPPVPTYDERAAEPNSNQRARFEERMRKLREREGDGEFTDFEDEALTEAERQRQEALAEGRRQQASGEIDPIEDEMRQEQLNESGAFGGTGCFSRVPDLSEHPDLRLAKTLSRDDFLEKRPDRTRLPGDIANSIGATVHATISCAVGIRLTQERDDLWIAEPKGVRYFALISRTRSWWNRDSDRNAKEVLAHEQLHVRMAELLAAELLERFETGTFALRTEGRSEATATARFQGRWGMHLQQGRDELRRMEKDYDRDTRYGADAARQAAWAERIAGGLAEIRAGMDL